MSAVVDLEHRIAGQREEILSCWMDRARHSASARGLGEPELRDLIGGVLDSLARDPSEVRTYAVSHLGGRIVLGFDVAEVVREFWQLEAAVVQVLERRERLPRDERERIRAALAEAVVGVTQAFQEHMDGDEQRDKRYVRLLQQIADDAIREPDPSLYSRLDEVIELIMEAMGAQSASLLLYDKDTDQLVTQASAGRAQDALRQIVTSTDPSEFTGKVASRDLPTSFDTISRELEISPALREAGIDVLLGVRLPPAATLVGIIYIGLACRRPFTERERMRLEMFGRWLTITLDNANLYSELREANAALRSERAVRERSVAMLAHDIRGPLSICRVSGQVLLRDPQLPARHRQLVDRAQVNLDLADRMIRDLLDVYRVQSGGALPLRVERFDLTEIAAEAVRELAHVHGPRFVLEASGPVWGYWSRDEVLRAVWNLGVNAVKYGASGASITIAVIVETAQVAVSVRNAGSVPRDRLERLLADSGHAGECTRGADSWGLGLAVVRAVADAHGGSVDASTDDETVTFRVVLPRDAR